MASEVTKTARKAARKGIKFLDKRITPVWRRWVNPDKFDLGQSHLGFDGSGCPITQLYGCYSDGVEALGLTREETTRYGFDTPEWSDETDYSYSVLTSAWIREFAKSNASE